MDDSESFDRLATDPDFRRCVGMMVQVMQIIVFALTLGVVFFGVTVVVARGVPAEAFRANGPLLGWIAVGFTAAILAVRPVALAVMTAAARKGKATNFGTGAHAASAPPFIRELQQRLPMVARWIQAYQTRLIVGCALLEGAAFFNLVACFAEPWIGNLAVAGVLVSMLLLQFPTRDRVVDWVGQQIRQSRIEA
jgi:hypothetical protein